MLRDYRFVFSLLPIYIHQTWGDYIVKCNHYDYDYFQFHDYNYDYDYLVRKQITIMITIPDYTNAIMIMITITWSKILSCYFKHACIKSK